MNIYTPNNGPSIYMKEKFIELKGEIDYFAVIVGDFTNLLMSDYSINYWK